MDPIPDIDASLEALDSEIAKIRAESEFVLPSQRIDPRSLFPSQSRISKIDAISCRRVFYPQTTSGSRFRGLVRRHPRQEATETYLPSWRARGNIATRTVIASPSRPRHSHSRIPHRMWTRRISWECASTSARATASSPNRTTFF